MSIPFPTKLRPSKASDVSLVIDSWLRSYYESPLVAWMPRGTYYRLYHPRVEETVAELGATIVCDVGDENHIYAWRCFDPGGLLHYTYTKAPYRGVGVAKLLLDDLPNPTICTHWTRAAEHIQKHHAFRFVPSAFWTRRALRFAHSEAK